MKKRFLLLNILVLMLFVLCSCNNKNNEIDKYTLLYKNQYQTIEIGEFKLSDVVLVSEKYSTSVCVDETMISSEDLEKLNNVGTHVIKVKYNNQEFEFVVVLANEVLYEINYKNSLENLKIDDFKLEDLELKITIDGNVQRVKVTESMLSSEDLALLKTAGTHTVVINYNSKEILFSITLLSNNSDDITIIDNPYIGDEILIDKFDLSAIKVVIKKGGNISYVDVTRDMLSSEDLALLKTPGNHNIKINYNNQIYNTTIILVEEIVVPEETIYELVNQYEGIEVKISDFNLSAIKIVATTGSKVETYNVNESMLSVADKNKLSTAGTHTIKVTYKDFVGEFVVKLISSGVGGDDIIDDCNGYYNAASGLTGVELKYALRTIISSGVRGTTYSELNTYLAKTDPGTKSGTVLLFYTRREVSSKWDSGKTWNKEHVWPKSKGWFDTSGAGSDIHHIRPANPTENSTRGNKPFSENGSTGTYTPSKAVRGDVARILFYLLVRYSEADNYNITAVATSMTMLLNWHEADPVDDIERFRNEEAYKIQGNRNPFIDNPSYAYYIWDMSRLNKEYMQSDIEMVILNIQYYFEDKTKKYFI